MIPALWPSSLASFALFTLLVASCSSEPTSGCPDLGACTTTSAGAGGSGGHDGTGGAGAGTFACKGSMCEAGKEQCAVDEKDEGSCFPLPKGCLQAGPPGPTCACFTDLPTECACYQDPKGNFIVQCTMTM